MGHSVSEEHRRIISETHKGRKHSEETKRKISDANKGKRLSEEHKRNLSLSHPALSGKNHPMYGKYHSEEARRKMSLAQSGEKNHCWRGGVSFEPYGVEFNDELKEQIRERDNYQCQVCGIYQKDLSRSIDIHHIDYCKQNNDPQNLIALCTSCHGKTQFNRGEWEVYFKCTGPLRGFPRAARWAPHLPPLPQGVPGPVSDHPGVATGAL